MSVAVASFAVFAASQVGTPGPANMALLATGAAHGLRTALPFVAGVVLGKQLIIWPIGFGVMELFDQAPMVFVTMKWVAAGYIFWLALRVSQLRLSAPKDIEKVPGFVAGLLVHPFNPKAWALILTGFTAFTGPGTPVLHATATIAVCLLIVQIVLHPIWALGGDVIARSVVGTWVEPWLMRFLALVTVASVFFVLFGGGIQ